MALNFKILLNNNGKFCLLSYSVYCAWMALNILKYKKLKVMNFAEKFMHNFVHKSCQKWQTTVFLGVKKTTD